MPVIHHVRVGVLGQVGRFLSPTDLHPPRGTRVVCRTRRGLEVGEVLGISGPNPRDDPVDGNLLRPITPEDDLLLERLERHREEAYAAFDVPPGIVPYYKLYDRTGNLRHRFFFDPVTEKGFTAEDIDKAVEELLAET